MLYFGDIKSCTYFECRMNHRHRHHMSRCYYGLGNFSDVDMMAIFNYASAAENNLTDWQSIRLSLTISYVNVLLLIRLQGEDKSILLHLY